MMLPPGFVAGCARVEMRLANGPVLHFATSRGDKSFLGGFFSFLFHSMKMFQIT